MSHARWMVLTWETVGRSSSGTASRPWMTVPVPVLGSDSHEARPGMVDPAAHRAVVVQLTEDDLGHVAGGLGHQLDGGELGRLVVEDPASQRVAHRQLDRRGHRGHAERDHEPHPVVAIPPPSQHAVGVDRRDEEAADHVGREDHVSGHQRHGVVEDDPPRVHVDHLARRVERESRRCVHPRVGRHHRDASQHARDDEGHTGPEVRPRLQSAPAVDVDRDEDRLGEEEEPLERERHPEGLAPLTHETGPQQAELEGEDRAGDRPDGERDGHVLRPSLGQLERLGVVALEPSVVGDERHERPGHTEGHEDDVAGQREGHLRPGPRHRVHGQDRLQETDQRRIGHRRTIDVSRMSPHFPDGRPYN